MGCDGEKKTQEEGTSSNTNTTMFERAVSHAKEFIEASPEDHKK
jgi:hypothetical protein